MILFSQMYVKGMAVDAFEHDVTPVDGYVNQLGETVIVGDDFAEGEMKEFAGLKSIHTFACNV